MQSNFTGSPADTSPSSHTMGMLHSVLGLTLDATAIIFLFLQIYEQPKPLEIVLFPCKG